MSSTIPHGCANLFAAACLDAVDALRYQPSALARGLRRDKTNMIGMVIPDVTNPFFPAVVRGAEDTAFSNGYRLVLCNTDNSHAKELEHLEQLRTYLPAGLIMIPSSFGKLSEEIESFRRAGTAVVLIDRMPRNWKGDSVTVSNEDGSFRAVQYLIQLGHKGLRVSPARYIYPMRRSASPGINVVSSSPVFKSRWTMCAEAVLIGSADTESH